MHVPNRGHIVDVDGTAAEVQRPKAPREMSWVWCMQGPLCVVRRICSVGWEMLSVKGAVTHVDVQGVVGVESAHGIIIGYQRRVVTVRWNEEQVRARHVAVGGTKVIEGGVISL